MTSFDLPEGGRVLVLDADTARWMTGVLQRIAAKYDDPQAPALLAQLDAQEAAAA